MEMDAHLGRAGEGRPNASSQEEVQARPTLKRFAAGRQETRPPEPSKGRVAGQDRVAAGGRAAEAWH